MSAYSYKPATLPQIFSKGAEALNVRNEREGGREEKRKGGK